MKTLKHIAALLLLIALPLMSEAQGRGKGKGKAKPQAPAKGTAENPVGTFKNTPPPNWATPHHYDASEHVYFPDFYTFYDPNRGGYVFWQDDRWIFSPSLPTFMTGVDLGTARIEPLHDITLPMHPEDYYARYFSTFPPRPIVNINIPIPPPSGRK